MNYFTPVQKHATKLSTTTTKNKTKTKKQRKKEKKRRKNEEKKMQTTQSTTNGIGSKKRPFRTYNEHILVYFIFHLTSIDSSVTLSKRKLRNSVHFVDSTEAGKIVVGRVKWALTVVTWLPCWLKLFTVLKMVISHTPLSPTHAPLYSHNLHLSQVRA